MPKKFVFDEVTGSCGAALIVENPNWCNTLESAEMNRAGVGIITLNYGDYKAAERYRELIVSCSSDAITFATYPATEVLKRYAITAFIHQGLRHIPSKMLAQVFKGYECIKKVNQCSIVLKKPKPFKPQIDTSLSNESLITPCNLPSNKSNLAKLTWVQSSNHCPIEKSRLPNAKWLAKPTYVLLNSNLTPLFLLLLRCNPQIRGGFTLVAVSYTHLTLPTTPYV